jgi:hypothetical protein
MPTRHLLNRGRITFERRGPYGVTSHRNRGFRTFEGKSCLFKTLAASPDRTTVCEGRPFGSLQAGGSSRLGVFTSDGRRLRQTDTKGSDNGKDRGPRVERLVTFEMCRRLQRFERGALDLGAVVNDDNLR